MSEKKEYAAIGSIINDIGDERIQKYLWERVAAVEKEKADYERNYYLQYDEFKLHNRKFGGNAKGIVPQEFNKAMDKAMRHEAIEALQEYKEKIQRIAEEKQGKQSLSPENKEEQKQSKENQQKETKYATPEDFQRLINQIAENRKLPHLSKKVSPAPIPTNKQLDEKIDPRRLAFREQMRQLKERNRTYKDKGLDKDL